MNIPLALGAHASSLRLRTRAGGPHRGRFSQLVERRCRDDGRGDARDDERDEHMGRVEAPNALLDTRLTLEAASSQAAGLI
jgi:hypothetical protein